MSKEEWKEFYEVWNEDTDIHEFFEAEEPARAYFNELVESDRTAHLHLGTELYEDDEPTGEFGEEDCLARFDDGRLDNELKIVA